ncbi:unnamed protein product [Rotaria socialis]|uniref:F-box domain-containing protein n=1 Tax=Rotaria socialis TaxID=392032 RepID=A0A817ZNS0_9BILA|nr:unnamed protein product [Rotaria socialis]CAF4446063.1 unnamed protein product [Rotaria socialis]
MYSLQTLPIELVHRIFDQLDIQTIIFSIRSTCKLLYAITNTYNRCALNFRYTSKSDLLLMSLIIDPKNVISLTLSDENETHSEIRFMFSHFHIDQFTRLRSLTLSNIKYDDLEKFQKHIMNYPLKRFSISSNILDSTKIATSISFILSHHNLREFEFDGSEQILNEIQWPVSCRLEHATIAQWYSWSTVYFVLSHLPFLRALVLKDDSAGVSFKHSIITQYDIKQLCHLSSLSLNSRYNLTTDNIQSLLVHLPMLTHLRLIGLQHLSDIFLFDGFQWENFIEKKLSALKKFEFWFRKQLNPHEDNTTVESIISTFRTSFWLKTKGWFVKCDHVENRYGQQLYLYSTTICQDSFDYLNGENTILRSATNNMNNHSAVIINTQRLSLDLNKYISNDTQQNTNGTTQYLFQNVRELTLMIGSHWPMRSIKYLSTILNLSNLQIICLHCKHRSHIETHGLDAVIGTLFKYTLNLRSFQINCNNFQTMLSMSLNDICLKLPHHIKHLATDIINMNDAKMILERAEHLSNVTFYRRDTYSFADEINIWLRQHASDSICKVGRDFRFSSYNDELHFPVHIWLNNSLHKQSNTPVSEKRVKRTHYT